MTAYNCYGMTCITGLTAQNTLGVQAIYPVTDQSFLEKSLEAVFSDVGVDAIKTGMMSTVATVDTIAAKLKGYQDGNNRLNLVVDPVMVSTSGANLIPEEAVDKYIDILIPLARVFTPNLIEAKYILEHLEKRRAGELLVSNKFEINSLDEMKAMAKELHERLKCETVLLKGGHIAFNKNLEVEKKPTKEGRVIVDVFYDGIEFHILQSDFIETKATHGTGCTLSSAIACNLALANRKEKKTLVRAVTDSVHYVQEAIRTAHTIGHGFGPVNHMHTLQHRPFVTGKFVDYLLGHPKVRENWERYVGHEFTRRLAHNTLDIKSFKFFLEQDYIYLKHYARCYGLGIYKSDDMETITKGAGVIEHIAHEMQLHVGYCQEFGLTIKDLERVQEGQATYAYSRWLLEVGAKDDWFALQVALSPCLFGYLEAAARLKRDPQAVSGHDKNPYWKWVETYTAPDFGEAADEGREILEAGVLKHSVDKIEMLVDIFATATRMECEFWDAALEYGKKE